MLALASALALAGFTTGAEAFTVSCSYCSHVTDTVSDNGNSTWTYNFTVHNDTTTVFNYGGYGGTTQNIVDWELPYFADAGISNIQSPSAGWQYAIETIGQINPLTGWNGVAKWQVVNDPMYSGANSPFTVATQVLHWYTTGGNVIGPGSALSGFGFTAAYGPTAAPYQSSWQDSFVKTGDPLFPNASFNAPAPPSATPTAPVPLPAAFTLLLSGIASAVVIGRRRNVL